MFFLETYSLLVKVAESLAQSLVAKIFVKAFEEVAQKLRKSPIIISSEEELDVKHQNNLQFINNEDIFSILEYQPLTINANYIGEKCFSIHWYSNGKKIVPKKYFYE